jgi:hypothetical protein
MWSATIVASPYSKLLGAALGTSGPTSSVRLRSAGDRHRRRHGAGERIRLVDIAATAAAWSGANPRRAARHHGGLQHQLPRRGAPRELVAGARDPARRTLSVIVEVKDAGGGPSRGRSSRTSSG